MAISKSQQWNHNNHYHNWILSKLPAHIEYTIDIGCGKGEFTRHLSLIAQHVDAIDNDTNIIKEAKQLSLRIKNITYVQNDFLQMDIPSEKYDAVVSIASLHHMNVSIALKKMKDILKPDGILVILGLYRNSTITDIFWSVISKLFDVIIKFLLHKRTSGNTGYTMQIVDPKETLREINATAKEILPNIKMRRHLFWRYSIIWTKTIG